MFLKAFCVQLSIWRTKLSRIGFRTQSQEQYRYKISFKWLQPLHYVADDVSSLGFLTLLAAR